MDVLKNLCMWWVFEKVIALNAEGGTNGTDEVVRERAAAETGG